MKLLLDENWCDHILADALRAAGHEVLRVVDAGLAGSEDPDVLLFAIEEGRALLTRDKGPEMRQAWEAMPSTRPLVLVKFSDDGLSELDVCSCLVQRKEAGLPQEGFEALVSWKPKETPIRAQPLR